MNENTAVVAASSVPMAFDPQAQQQGLSREKIELLKTTIAKGASDSELALFVEICNRTGLDPFARQIYAVQRKGKDPDGQYREHMVTQVSIDGFRLIAERSGKYAGPGDALWCGDDGEWKDVWLAQVPPAAAKVGVWRTTSAHQVFAVALWREYAQTYRDGNPSPMWAKMPALMLAKCAEALALRKAFPQELSGLYTDVEMAQASNPVSPVRQAEVIEGAGRAALPAAAEDGVVEGEVVEKPEEGVVEITADSIIAALRLSAGEIGKTKIDDSKTAGIRERVSAIAVEAIADTDLNGKGVAAVLANALGSGPNEGLNGMSQAQLRAIGRWLWDDKKKALRPNATTELGVLLSGPLQRSLYERVVGGK